MRPESWTVASLTRMTAEIADGFDLDVVTVFDSDLRAMASFGSSQADEPHAVRGSASRSRALAALELRTAQIDESPDHTAIAIPMIAGDGDYGVLYIERAIAVAPLPIEIDVRLLGHVATHAASGLALRDANDALERTCRSTVHALEVAMQTSDRYTHDHSHDVAALAVETGRRLGMDRADLRELELGALLHDIGKIGIPTQILQKPGALTEHEFEVMKTHTILGEQIIAPIGFLAGVRPIVRHEHERWDGRGYPDGLEGEDIPLGSRIILVCDAYHAMTSDRPYRQARPTEEARQQLVDCAGTQFDPAVVSVFLDVLDTLGSDAVGEAGRRVREADLPHLPPQQPVPAEAERRLHLVGDEPSDGSPEQSNQDPGEAAA